MRVMKKIHQNAMPEALRILSSHPRSFSSSRRLSGGAVATLMLVLMLSLLPVGQTQAATEYVKTSRWSFSYTNDGMEGIVLRNVWYTAPSGQSAKVAQWLALEFLGALSGRCGGTVQ